MKFKEKLQQWERQRIIRLLCNSDPETIQKMGEKALIPAFRRAARLVPAYRNILQNAKVDISRINDAADFKNEVPIIDKSRVFPGNEIEDLCINGSLKDMKWPNNWQMNPIQMISVPRFQYWIMIFMKIIFLM